MATFPKGQSMKAQRVHITGVFDQKGKGMSGKNVAFSISNDTREPGAGAFADPMLVYDKYKDGDGNEKPTYTASYSEKQWEDIEAAANKDGDALVLEADLFPSKRGKGLVVNTATLKTPDVPFDNAKHKENTLAERALRAEARKEKAAAREADKGKDKEADQALEA